MFGWIKTKNKREKLRARYCRLMRKAYKPELDYYRKVKINKKPQLQGRFSRDSRSYHEKI